MERCVAKLVRQMHVGFVRLEEGEMILIGGLGRVVDSTRASSIEMVNVGVARNKKLCGKNIKLWLEKQLDHFLVNFFVRNMETSHSFFTKRRKDDYYDFCPLDLKIGESAINF